MANDLFSAPRDGFARFDEPPATLHDAALDERESPIYLFRVPALVFEPFEAVASLAIALLRDPARVARVRFVLEGEPSRRRADLVAALRAPRRGITEKDRTSKEEEAAFAPVVLQADSYARSSQPVLVDVVKSTFAWLGLRPEDAPYELGVVAHTATLDDEERSLRGELSVLATRSSQASHLFLFDDGSRELVKISVPREETSRRTTDNEPHLADRLDALLRDRS